MYYGICFLLGMGYICCKYGIMQESWINIHTHKPGQGINIVDPCLGEVQIPVNGIVYYSLGIHPMYIDEQVDLRLEQIEQAAVEKRIVAIGEAGLDRNSPAAMELQQELFEKQAELAARYDLPLIIHGVRAIPELIATYKKCHSRQKWIIHGFNNRVEILQDLLRHGFYISAGRYCMNEDSHIWKLLPEIPADRLFIETDNSDYSIEDVYRKVAERRGVTVEVLQEEVKLNFERLFFPVHLSYR